MAARKTTKRTTGKKSTGRKQTTRKTAPKKTAVKKVKSSSGIGIDIMFLVILALAVLLFISNIGLGGAVGNTVSRFLFGVFGTMNYCFPFVLFFGVAFWFANKTNDLIFRKLLGLVLLFAFLAAFIEVALSGYTKGQLLTEYFKFSSEDHMGGGLLGGAIVYVFGYAFGTVGAYILTVIGIIMSLIILTQKPLLQTLSAKGKHAADRAHERRMAEKQVRMETRKDLDTDALKEKIREKVLAEIERDYRKEEESELRKQAAIARKEERIRQIKEEQRAKEAARNSVELSSGDVYAYGDETDHPDNGFDSAGFMEKADLTPGKGEEHSENYYDDLDFEPVKAQTSDSFVPSFLRKGKGTETPDKTDKTAASPDTVSGGEERPADAEGIRRTRRKSTKKADPGSVDTQEISKEISDTVSEEIQKPRFTLPTTDLMAPVVSQSGSSHDLTDDIDHTFASFGIGARVNRKVPNNPSFGPSVTQYKISLDPGVKVSRILGLENDLKLALRATDIRIEAPIPGTSLIGIEVPNSDIAVVPFRELLESREYVRRQAPLTFAVGKDLAGKVVCFDIEKMPHLLIAGTTGSGKSVCINTLIMSILFKSTPEEVRFLMIDPKVVELKIYDGIPHLLIPVVTDAKKAAGALNWAVQEMTERYNKFALMQGVRDIKAYNAKVEELNQDPGRDEKLKKMPQIVIIVDELADLMMVASSEVEDAIVRLTQLARAAGIHLIVATQRPSVNVVTGLIKANMPSRIALSVSSGVDSRTIIDMNGAEKLLGKGDMLFYPQGYPKPVRVQGAFLSDSDIARIVSFLTAQLNNDGRNKEEEERIKNHINSASSQTVAVAEGESDKDEYFEQAARLIIEKDKASIGMLQRSFKIGFNRAARIMDQLCDAGVVGAEEGTKPRKILMKLDEFEASLSQTE